MLTVLDGTQILLLTVPALPRMHAYFRQYQRIRHPRLQWRDAYISLLPSSIFVDNNPTPFDHLPFAGGRAPFAIGPMICSVELSMPWQERRRNPSRPVLRGASPSSRDATSRVAVSSRAEATMACMSEG
jgi:hypothetical protein